MTDPASTESARLPPRALGRSCKPHAAIMQYQSTRGSHYRGLLQSKLSIDNAYAGYARFNWHENQGNPS